MYAHDTQAHASAQTHTCTHTQSVLNDHIRRTRRRPSQSWWWSQLGCFYLMTFLLLFPSSIFMLQRAFALVPWNMDAVWKEERRPTFHCHMRMDRKRSWWRVFQNLSEKGNIPCLCISQFFYVLICHLNSNHCRGLRGKCVRGMWITAKLGRGRGSRKVCWVYVCVCVREREIRERGESVLERDRGRLVSPAPQCLDKLQQQGAEDSAEMKQDAGSTQHFKENLRVLETKNLWITVAKHTV